MTQKDEGLLDSLTLEDEGIFFSERPGTIYPETQCHIVKDLILFIALLPILNLEARDSGFRNLVTTVRDSGFCCGIMRSSLFGDVTPC